MSLSIFILGLIVGSFLNVVILRHNTGKSVSGRSGCLSCGKTLTWKELIPVFSFLFQGGKCRGCKSKISWQYPLVELITGILFLSIYLSFKHPLLVALNWVVASILVIITAYDFKHKIIPDSFVYTFVFLGLLKPLIKYLGGVNPTLFFYFYQAILAGLLVALPFLVLWLVSKGRWLGFGDVKLALGMGLWLGISGGFSAVILAVWIGAVVGLLLVAVSKLQLFSKRRRYTIKSELPFAPFLILGFFLHLIFSINVFSLWQF